MANCKESHELDMPINEIIDFCQRWRIKEFSIFGSILRKEFTPDSDVDVLVSFFDDVDWGLFELVDMKEELRGIFHRPVDIIEKEALKNPFRKKEILRTRQIIYAA